VAKYRITNPAGEQYDLTAPDEANEHEVMQVAQQHFAQAASDRGAMEKVADPTAGMSGPEKSARRGGQVLLRRRNRGQADRGESRHRRREAALRRSPRLAAPRRAADEKLVG
jgi:hypothetical protein